MRRFFLFLTIAGTLVISNGMALQAAARPVHIVFDTDWWTDVDDACAVRLLHEAERAGKIKVDGICISALRQTSLPSLRAFLDNEGWDMDNIGADYDATDYPGVPCYHNLLIQARPQAAKPDAVSDAAEFYRKILAKAEGKVDIVVVGHANCLEKLLESGPDKWSQLDGISLVKEKVGTLWMMAGNYPEGMEHNFNYTPRSRRSGSVVCEKWPGKIVFLGFEIGTEVQLGAPLGDDDLLHKVIFRLEGKNARYAWDPLTAYLAICKDVRKAGFKAVRGYNKVNPSTGYNTFTEDRHGPHSYVKFEKTPRELTETLDKILLR